MHNEERKEGQNGLSNVPNKCNSNKNVDFEKGGRITTDLGQ